MAADRIDRVEQLFFAAKGLDEVRRSALLLRECADDEELRTEVESLLAESDEAPDYLNRPAWKRLLDEERAEGRSRPGRSSGREPDASLPFERLGEYRLLRRLGDGGMGTVYLATQESLGREVALKVIRPERAGSPEVEARFRREAEAVSRLRHPGIVAVYGSGEDQGVQYFAMEFLDGAGLDELLQEGLASGDRVPIEQVVDWTLQIALALGAAHRAGIIHRDVKPSNIRVTDQGAKLMDFGIARQADLSTLTIAGSFRGTPSYASPEQISGKSGEIDARTDIYSLGVTLYEAVTGRQPFTGETTDQVFHQILEADPLPPRRLNLAVPRDLDLIILTALARNSSNRYQSAGDLAEDLRRFQVGDSILARPPGPAARCWKWVRRHPASSAAAGVGIAAAFSFLYYVLFWSLPRITDEKNSALAANRVAIEQQLAAEQSRDSAEAARARAEANLDFLLDMISWSDPAHSKGEELTVLELLDRSAASVDEQYNTRPVEAAALHEVIATSYHNLGRQEQAERHARAAVALRQEFLGSDDPETLYSKHNLSLTLISRSKLSEAVELIRSTLEARTRVLGASHSATLESRLALVLCLRERSELAELEQELRDLLATVRGATPVDEIVLGKALSEMARLLHDQDRLDEAEPLFLEALEVHRRVDGVDGREYLVTLGTLAMNLQEQGRLEEAEKFYRESLAGFVRVYGEEHANTLMARSQLAYLYQAQGRLAAAQSVIEEVLVVQRRIGGSESMDVLRSLCNLATLVHQQGDVEGALLHAEEGLAIAGLLLPADHYVAYMARAIHGSCVRDLEQFEEAELELLDAYRGMTGLMGDGHPVSQEVAEQLFVLYERWGRPEAAAKYRLLMGDIAPLATDG